MVRAHDLETQLHYYQNVFEERFPAQMVAGPLVLALRELYATKCAIAVLSCVELLCGGALETARKLVGAREPASLPPPLPPLESIRNTTPSLLDAVTRKDKNEVAKMLGANGVLELCLRPEQQFDRLEFRIGCVVGRTRLIPLVELGILAADSGAFDRATIYVADAHGLIPGPPELHDLLTVAGTIALNSGELGRAKAYLAESILVCQEDDFARLTCGATRVLNLMLAERLLERGEDGAVVEYLAQCKNVWEFESKRFASWIEAIKQGQSPDFRAPSVLNGMNIPAVKMRELMVRSSFLAEDCQVASQNPGRGTHIGRDAMRAEYERRMAAAINGKLDTGKN